MKKKNVLGVVTSAALIAASVMGSAVPALAESAEEVTLTFWTPSWREGAEAPIIEDFMKKYPNIKIDVTYMSSDDIKANTKIAASSGTLPDMWYNWSGVLAEFYAENGLCMDLTDYAAENGWDEKYLEGAIAQCSYDGKLIGLPQNLVSLDMYYRADLFEQYGIEEPTTMEELEAACDTLLENGVTPFAAGAGSNIMRYTEALLEYYCGAEEHDSLLSLEADWSASENVAKAFAKLKEWNDKGYFPKDVLTADAPTTKMYVYSGSSAMVMENPGMAAEIVANEDDAAKYGWFAFPTNDEGTGRMSAYAKMCQFNAELSEEKLDAAMLFWDYYYSDESLAAHTAIEQPTALAGAELPENYALAEGVLDDIEAKGGFSTMDLKIPAEVMSQYFSLQDAVILGQTTPEDAGAQMQAAIESYKANQ